MVDGCLVCDEVSGRLPVPGGLLQDDDRWCVFHSPIVDPATDVYAGQLFICPKRHVAGFSGLSDDEAASAGPAIARWSRALESAGADHVYVLRIGHRVPHLHIHLVPRWPETPDNVSWLEVDEWPGARRGDFHYATDFVRQLRAAIARDAPGMG